MRHTTIALLLLAAAALLPATARVACAELGDPWIATDAVLVHCRETTCNSYVVTCRKTGRFAVVDPGPGMVADIQAWQLSGHELTAFWITHAHGDHVAGLGEVGKAFDVPVLAHLAARKQIALMAANWAQWGLDEMSPLPPPLPDTIVADGSIVELGALRFEVLFAPGHEPGSVLFRLADELVLVGDVLFQGSVGRTDLGTSDPESFARSLATKVWDLPADMAVLPGHMGPTTIQRERESNWLFQDLVRTARGEEPIPRPWMGVEIEPDHEGEGVRLRGVAEGSPAAEAGLQPGDVLLRMDGTRLDGPQALVGVIRSHGVGDGVEIVVARAGAERTLTLTFRTRPR